MELDPPFRRQRHDTQRPKQGEGRRDREVGQAEEVGDRAEIGDHRIDLLRADDRDRDDRRSRPDRGLDVAAAAEPAQPVPVRPPLAGALHALGKHQHQLVPLQQAVRVIRVPDGLAGPAEKAGEAGHPDQEGSHQRPGVARLRVGLEERGLDHGAVPGQHPRVVRDQQRPARGGHVLHPGRLHPPVGVVDPAEGGQEGLGVGGVKAELVNLDVLTPGHLCLLVEELDDCHHRRHVDDFPPGQPAERLRQPADRLERPHRRLAAEPPHRARQLDPDPAPPVDLAPGADLKSHIAIKRLQPAPLNPIGGLGHEALVSSAAASVMSRPINSPPPRPR